MLKIAVSRMNELFSLLNDSAALYLPVEKCGQVNFDRWTPDADVRLDALNTVKSAKDLFFPQSENLVSFKMEGKNIEIKQDMPSDQPFVVFGVRACDARSFDVLDKVFLANPVDTYYKARRDHGTIITMACSQPEETCFCGVFGIDATQPNGDVSAWMTDDVLYLQAGTEKGGALLEKIMALTEEADAQDTTKLEEHNKAVRAILDKLPLNHLDLTGFNGDALNEKFNAPEWADLSKTCLGCGACTFVCPTCQCYDVRDYDTGHGVQRFRCWDSCMYSDFTLMAHGNPRKTQLERFRQRFMHKLIYFPANNDGMYSCVGCGRCVSKCPISMNIAKVIKALGEKKNV